MEIHNGYRERKYDKANEGDKKRERKGRESMMEKKKQGQRGKEGKEYRNIWGSLEGKKRMMKEKLMGAWNRKVKKTQ